MQLCSRAAGRRNLRQMFLQDNPRGAGTPSHHLEARPASDVAFVNSKLYSGRRWHIRQRLPLFQKPILFLPWMVIYGSELVAGWATGISFLMLTGRSVVKA